MEDIVIALAREADREDCLGLLESRHNESLFSDVPFGEDKFDKFFSRVLKGTAIGIVAKYNDKSIGIAYASVGIHCTGLRDTVANILVAYVDRELRQTDIGRQALVKMLSAIKQVAQRENVSYLTTHFTDGIDAHFIDNTLRSLGGNTLGGNYLFKL